MEETRRRFLRAGDAAIGAATVFSAKRHPAMEVGELRRSVAQSGPLPVQLAGSIRIIELRVLLRRSK